MYCFNVWEKIVVDEKVCLKIWVNLYINIKEGVLNYGGERRIKNYYWK